MDDLRQVLPDCELCAFVDLDVRLVLSVSAPARPPQEQLDALAQRAAWLLETSAPGDPANSSGPSGSPLMHITPAGALALIRAPWDPNEVFCCQFSRAALPGAAAQAAQRAASWIGDAA